MKTIKKSLFLLALSMFAVSCSKDDNSSSTQPLETKTISNLYAPVTSAPGAPATGDFIKFSFSTGAVVTTGDDWDIAFRSTTILVNGGVTVSGQPTRTGVGAASVVTGVFANVTTAPEDALFNQDSATANAILTGSGNGWYNYDGATNIISPIAGRVIVVKTHDGKYAKMEILSYYQNAPASPTSADAARYYKFNYIYQANGTKTF